MVGVELLALRKTLKQVLDDQLVRGSALRLYTGVIHSRHDYSRKDDINGDYNYDDYSRKDDINGDYNYDEYSRKDDINGDYNYDDYNYDKFIGFTSSKSSSYYIDVGWVAEPGFTPAIRRRGERNIPGMELLQSPSPQFNLRPVLEP